MDHGARKSAQGKGKHAVFVPPWGSFVSISMVSCGLGGGVAGFAHAESPYRIPHTRIGLLRVMFLVIVR